MVAALIQERLFEASWIEKISSGTERFLWSAIFPKFLWSLQSFFRRSGWKQWNRLELARTGSPQRKICFKTVPKIYEYFISIGVNMTPKRPPKSLT